MATAGDTLNFAPAPHWTRQQIEDAIEALIARLDELDGDPDLEPEHDADVDDQPCPVINLFRGDLAKHRHNPNFGNEDMVAHYGVDQDAPRMGAYAAADSLAFVPVVERAE